MPNLNIFDKKPISIKRLFVATALVLGLASLLVRYLLPSFTYYGYSAQLLGGTLILAISSARLGMVIFDIYKKQIPWTQIILPIVISLGVALLLFGKTTRQSLILLITVLELGLLGLGVIIAWQKSKNNHNDQSFDDLLEESLLSFLPAQIAPWVKVEMVVIYSALQAILHGFRVTPIAGHGYAQSSHLQFIPMLLLITSVPEMLLVEVIIHAQPLWLKILVIVIEIWAILWTYGLYITMLNRPHQITSAVVKFYRGALSQVSIPLNNIKDVAPLPASVDARQLKRTSDAQTSWLTIPGSPLVKVILETPLTFSHGHKNKALDHVNCLMVAADKPTEFSQAILQAKLLAATKRL